MQHLQISSVKSPHLRSLSLRRAWCGKAQHGDFGDVSFQFLRCSLPVCPDVARELSS